MELSSRCDSSGLRLGHWPPGSPGSLSFLVLTAPGPLSLSPHRPRLLPVSWALGGRRRALSPEWHHVSGLPGEPAHRAVPPCGIDLAKATPAGLPGGPRAQPPLSRCQLRGQDAKAPRPPPSFPKVPTGPPPQAPGGRPGAILGPADFPVSTAELSPVGENTGNN